MFDHVGIKVRDLSVSARFYDAVLGPLGTKRSHSDETMVGYGAGESPTLWLYPDGVTSSVHIAFASGDRRAVDASYAAGLEFGGKDNGAPGVRPDYGPTYFAAFLIDPDGNNIELVCTLEDS